MKKNAQITGIASDLKKLARYLRWEGRGATRVNFGLMLYVARRQASSPLIDELLSKNKRLHLLWIKTDPRAHGWPSKKSIDERDAKHRM